MSMVHWIVAVGSTTLTVHSSLRGLAEEMEIGSCPRCDMIFSMVETTPSGERVQHVEMQERGKALCCVSVPSLRTFLDPSHQMTRGYIARTALRCFLAQIRSTDPQSFRP